MVGPPKQWISSTQPSIGPALGVKIELGMDQPQLKLYLNNLNDAGKIRIEKTCSVQQSRNYQVKVTYSFATQDWGDVNSWTIITGALPEHPQVTQDLSPAFQGDSSSGSTAPTEFVWLDKSYTYTDGLNRHNPRGDWHRGNL